MNTLIYSITLDNVTLELEENSFGFCISVNFGHTLDVYCFNNLSASIEAFESLIPILFD